MSLARTIVLSVAVVAALAGARGSAQQPGGGRQGGAPAPAPRDAAPVDLTGYWVAVVTEDWRWRMVTPPKGDYASVPLTAEGRKVADAWDPATDGSCLAYGAPGLMRMPTRLHITWSDASTLAIESDAGQQTRVLHFGGEAPVGGERTLQGHSVASWELPAGGRGGRGGRGGGAAPAGPRWAPLRVVTTNLRAGWLRRNGVPYSENAQLTETFIRFSDGASEWLTVTARVSDPRYLNQEFLTSSNFRREPDGSRFRPVPCQGIT